MTTDFGRRLKQARKHAKLTQAQLAPLAGMSQSNLSELETVAYESGKTVQLAAALGVDAHWLATGEGHMLGGPAVFTGEQAHNWMQPHPAFGGLHVRGRGISLAHELIQTAAPNALPVLDWSDPLTGPLPNRFMLPVRDDSMTLLDPPSMRPGDLAIFAPSDKAMPGSVVLVADRDGNIYIRRYLQRTPTRWLAVARNDAYEPLDSERDGLRVLAIQVGGLWGETATEGVTIAGGANHYPRGA